MDGQGKRQARAFHLSLISGILIILNTIALGVAARWFPGLIPTLPGTTGNDTGLLYRLSTFGFFCGILVFAGALLLKTRPNHTKAWGAMILVFSIPSVITGGGFIIGFILGIIGGFTAITQHSRHAAEQKKT